MRIFSIFAVLALNIIFLAACSNEATTPTTGTDKNNLGSAYSITTSSSCTSSHQKVGTSAEFTSFFHGVSGTLTIIDDCTLKITNFNYDGGGPQVYFYGGINGVFTGTNAFILSLEVSGNIFEDNTLILELPAGKTLDDFDSISIWCVDFQINFGQVNI